MDLISIERIKKAHPSIRAKLLKGYTDANNKLGKNVRLRITRVYSTNAEQDELFAIGRTKRGRIVTKAKGGESIHNYGGAWDIVLLIDLDGNGTFETASWDVLKDWDKDTQSDWMEVVAVFKALGAEWGGDWRRFPDGPHFQIKKPNGQSYTWRELKRLVDTGETIVDGGIIYPKLP